MIKLSNKAIAFNIGAVTIMVAACISFVRSTFARPYVEVCTSRYHKKTSMRLDRDGAPLQPSDVQSVANGHDEGLLENLQIAQFREGPTKYAMGIKLAKGTAEQRSQRALPGGISLPWAPSTIEQPTAACLSYDIFLPADFDFNLGGTLPGIYGTTVNGQFTDTPGFSSALSWSSGGAPKLFVDTKTAENPQAVAYDSYEASLPRGRWVHVDQEVVLNSPNQTDGIARLWLDGRIESDNKTVAMRTTADVAIAGVAGEVYFGGSGTGGTATTDATVWLSPFEIRWK